MEELYEGMNTLWGTLQWTRTLAPGVYWVDTIGHGGLLISVAVAQRTLTPQACRIGERWGNWICFEEDCAVAAPLYEHPEWQKQLGGSPEDYDPAGVLRRYFPAYFEAPVQLFLTLPE